ncbi:Kv channel interacting protein 3a, calsenilin isoform X2, partial [Tachysurus ichikawai]
MTVMMVVVVEVEDGKIVDGGLLGDANGVGSGSGRQKDSGKWQRPRFTRKALMRCCLLRWIIASTSPKEQAWRFAFKKSNNAPQQIH